jgi:dihydrodipicolinate synthase/N-acetylneuraminate lyase
MKTPYLQVRPVALVTPFSDGKINYKNLGGLIDFQINSGPLPSTSAVQPGRAHPILEEHMEAVDFCVK